MSVTSLRDGSSDAEAGQGGPLSDLLIAISRDPSDLSLLLQLRALFDRKDARLAWYLDHDDAICRGALTALLAEPSAPVGWLAPIVAAQICIRYGFDGELRLDRRSLRELARDTLWLTALRETINAELVIEDACIEIRAALVAAPLEPDLYPLLAALALQAWNNEYVWDESASETAAIAALPSDIDRLVKSGDVDAWIEPLLRWAMYRPLRDLSSARDLAARPIESLPPVLRPLWRDTLLDPRDEDALGAAMPALGPIAEPTSRAVRLQYEQNPFPRWRHPLLAHRSILASHRLYEPVFAWEPPIDRQLQILVAGGGTGQHPLAVARANPDADVLALDLSVRSLAYAQRMAEKLGIGNVSFRHADLLQLPVLGKRFDHVECLGVLHHMADQAAAWRSLTSVLRPGGTLTVAVYSQAARDLVTRLRDRIAREAVPPTPDGIRRFRTQLLCEPESVATVDALRRGFSFFSTSELRDLLFHVHEHQYTLAELEEHARECGLQLLGYEPPSHLGRREHRFRDHRTFESWRRVEELYIGTLEMFLCTLRRPLAE